MDAIFTAFPDKIQILFIVKEHLSDYKIRAHLDFLFEVLEIGFKIWGFKMFLWISGYSDAKISMFAAADAFMEVTTLINVFDVLQQFGCVGMPARCRYKFFVCFSCIASEHEDVVDA